MIVQQHSHKNWRSVIPDSYTLHVCNASCNLCFWPRLGPPDIDLSIEFLNRSVRSQSAMAALHFVSAVCALQQPA